MNTPEQDTLSPGERAVRSLLIPLPKGEGCSFTPHPSPQGRGLLTHLEKAADSPGERAADSLGEKAAHSLGEKAAHSLGEEAAHSLGEKAAHSLGERAADSLGEGCPLTWRGLVVHFSSPPGPPGSPPETFSVRKTLTRLLGPCLAFASLMALVRRRVIVETASSTRPSSIAPTC